MSLAQRLAQQAALNARLVNLDLPPEERAKAIRDASARLRAIASMPPLTKGAENIERVVLAQLPLVEDKDGFLTMVADALASASDQGDGQVS